MSEPRKTLPKNTYIRTEYIDEICEVPSGCCYRIVNDYDSWELQLYTKEEIPNPNYEAELKAYNDYIEFQKQQKADKAKKYRENKKQKEEFERSEYERLKKKFGDK